MWDLKVLKIAGVALIGCLFASQASAATAFGSKLGHEPTPPERCRPDNASKLCTWILTIGHQNVGKERAPKNGTVAKLRLRSCTPGTFILQIARANTATEQGKVIRTGPFINYKGNPSNCNGGTVIETFNVNVPVRTGRFPCNRRQPRRLHLQREWRRHPALRSSAPGRWRFPQRND